MIIETRIETVQSFILHVADTFGAWMTAAKVGDVREPSEVHPNFFWQVTLNAAKRGAHSTISAGNDTIYRYRIEIYRISAIKYR